MYTPTKKTKDASNEIISKLYSSWSEDLKDAIKRKEEANLDVLMLSLNHEEHGKELERLARQIFRSVLKKHSSYSDISFIGGGYFTDYRAKKTKPYLKVKFYYNGFGITRELAPKTVDCIIEAAEKFKEICEVI